MQSSGKQGGRGGAGGVRAQEEAAVSNHVSFLPMFWIRGPGSLGMPCPLERKQRDNGQDTGCMIVR